MVELALAMPLLLVMLFGCIEAGLLFCDAIVLGNAARESVRMASVGAPTNQIGLVVGTTLGVIAGALGGEAAGSANEPDPDPLPPVASDRRVVDAEHPDGYVPPL